MTRVIGNTIIIESTAPAPCEDCGKVAELRPYGPGGMQICIECALKDPIGTKQRMGQFLDTGKIEKKIVN